MNTLILIGILLGAIMAAFDLLSFKATKKMGAGMGLMVWILMASIGAVAFQFSVTTGVTAILTSVLLAGIALVFPKNPYVAIANHCNHPVESEGCCA